MVCCVAKEASTQQLLAGSTIMQFSSMRSYMMPQ